MQYTLKTIKNAFENLQDYANRYQRKDLQNELQAKIANRLTMEYRIAIVANMSAGKSTFINALFGEEILPAFNHATTDCATYITSTQDKDALIYFSDKNSIALFYDNHENFIRELQQYAQKDEECNDDKYKNVTRIDLHYPLKNIYTQNAGEMQVIFIDTPGPNATGENYAEKHKVQTQNVLNDVDLALFLFDYGQLDATLKGDKHGLWEVIKERAKKDKDFEVFFVLNKIDMALSDNATNESDWFYHEQKAIEKLRQAAIKHGIQDSKIYPTSSLYALLCYKTNKSDDEEDEIEGFERKFKREFGDDWEDRLTAYLGIEAFTKAINAHIAHKPQKRWEELTTKMKEIIVAENQRIENDLMTYIKNANEYNMQDLLQEINKLYDEEIRQLEVARDKNNIHANPDAHNMAEKITRQAIAFLQAYLEFEYDKQKAIFYAVDRSWTFELSAFHKIDITHQRNLKIGNTLQSTLQDFIQKQLNKIGKTASSQLPRNILAYYDTFSKHWGINGVLLVEYIGKIIDPTIPSNPNRIIFDELIEIKKKHLVIIQNKITKLQEIEERKKNEEKEKMQQLKTLHYIQNLLS